MSKGRRKLKRGGVYCRPWGHGCAIASPHNGRQWVHSKGLAFAFPKRTNSAWPPLGEVSTPIGEDLPWRAICRQVGGSRHILIEVKGGRDYSHSLVVSLLSMGGPPTCWCRPLPRYCPSWPAHDSPVDVAENVRVQAGLLPVPAHLSVGPTMDLTHALWHHAFVSCPPALQVVIRHHCCCLGNAPLDRLKTCSSGLCTLEFSTFTFTFLTCNNQYHCLQLEMADAEDKIFNGYLRRNMAKIVTEVKVREIVSHLPSLTQSDRVGDWQIATIRHVLYNSSTVLHSVLLLSCIYPSVVSYCFCYSCVLFLIIITSTVKENIDQNALKVPKDFFAIKNV